MRVILFDLDGTLIDSTNAILDGFRHTFEKFNKKYPGDEEVKRLIGLPLDVMFSNLGIKENVWDFVNAYKERYRVISKEKTTLLPTAKEAIKEAKEFARLGIVTTKTGLYSRELLEYFGVMDYFEVLIGREDVKNPKPHPEPILKAIHLMNANKQATWMIGDTCLDMVSAKEAGVNYIGVEFDYEDKEELKKCAEVTKPDALEAIRYIKTSSKNLC
ncbi:MAG: HAD family hydrolase [Nautiliaceae bacterium]